MLHGLSSFWLLLSLIAQSAVNLGAPARSASPFSVLRTIPVAKNPVAVAIDSRVGHVFVLSQQTFNALSRPPGTGRITMISAMTGAVLRSIPTGLVGLDDTPSGVSTQSLAIDEETDRVFVLNGSLQDPVRLAQPGSVQVLDSTNGNAIGSVQVGQYPRAVAVDARSGHVFVATTYPKVLPTHITFYPTLTGTVSMLDARSGALLRTVAVGIGPVALAVDSRLERVFVAQRGPDCPSNPNGPICHGSITVLNAVTGAVITTVPTIRSCAIAVAQDAARVFVDNITYPRAPINYQTGVFTLFNAQTGARLRTLSLGDTSCSAQEFAMDEAAHHVVIGTGEAVRMLDAVTGSLLHTIPVAGLYLALDVTRHLIVALGFANFSGNTQTPPGELHFLAATSGNVLGSLPVGAGPKALTVDAATGHAFVVNLGDNSVSMINLAAGS